MKKWIAAILTLVMLTQALPWTAFAKAIAAGQMITDKELQRALQIAGMKVVTGDYSSEKTVTAKGALTAAASNDSSPVRLEAKDSGYHPGMTPDETWDAQMLMDWLDDKLNRDIYNVTNVYVRAETILEKLKDEDPDAYARLTQNADFVETCHKWAMDAEAAKEEARLLDKRLGENTVVIENNTEMLVNCGDSLFIYEKARYSEQIREATEALEELREDILAFSIAQMLIVITGQLMIDGTVEPEFSAWLKEVLDAEDGPQEVTVSADTVMAAPFNTLQSRMAASKRVLAKAGSQEVTVQVITENDFTIITRGVDNQPVGGVKVTVKDVNGTAEKTRTTDGEFGSAVFNANDFVCDYDKTMEISLTVEAEALGYRDFYIPWLEMKRGGKRTETLVLLTGPEETPTRVPITDGGDIEPVAKSGEEKPYIYSCMFNGYDILRKDHKVVISPANDAYHEFVLVLYHAAGAKPEAPVLHYIHNDGNKMTTVERKVDNPKEKKLSDTRTEYTYSAHWKRDLSPDISSSQFPWFVIPDTGEVVRTKLIPVRAAVNNPAITGSEPINPLNSILGPGLDIKLGIPGGWGNLGLNIPMAEALPKVAYNPTGYLTVTYGSAMLSSPEQEPWKNKESVKYDKEQKKYEHESAKAKIAQKLGAAKQYYKSPLKSKIQRRVKVDFGYFIMLSGRAQMDEERADQNASSLWSATGAAGMHLVLSADFTKPMAVMGVPFYVNLNISASAGIAVDGLYFSFYSTDVGVIDNVEFHPVRGITIEIRLALTLTLGVGIRGLASAWVSITGAMNIIIQIMIREPVHIAIYLEAWATVGFEFFWIRYSWMFWKSPRAIIYQNYELNAKGNFSLFTAYAEEDGDASQKEDVVPQEPESYPQLAPVATKIIDNAEYVKAGIKTAVIDGHTVVFYIGRSKDSGGNTSYNVNYIEPATGRTGTVAAFIDERIGYMDDYAFDVLSNGSQAMVVACCADGFDENGYPRGNTNGKTHSYCYAVFMGYFDYEDKNRLVADSEDDLRRYATSAVQYNTGYNVLLNPHIDSVTSNTTNMDRLFVTGSCDALYDATGAKGFVNFQWNSDRLVLMGDVTAKAALGDDHERVQVRSTFRNGDIGEHYSWHSSMQAPLAPGFVALSRPGDGAEGQDAIELFDYFMNVAPIKTQMDMTDKTNITRQVLFSERRAIALATGEIGQMEVLSHTGSSGDVDLWTVFYTQAETVDERTEYRLKSLEFQPRTMLGKDDFKYEVTFRDYDVSIPNASFRAVTIGTSQYLYWLTGAGREGEDVPGTWRITGIYYDAVTGTMSDEIVIAEFSLPESAWNGQRYKNVPYEIMLTETGAGYITAKPDTGDAENGDIAPMTLYSFPITLKPVATLKGAALMETTVCQGEMAAADLSVMNEGNMGIGSFDVELWLMENGREKQKVETLHADCLAPANSALVLHKGDENETVAKGEAAFYRLKDFVYSPRQSEWIVNTQKKSVHIKNGNSVTTNDGSDDSNRLVTNVLVPGTLGSFSGSIKIPSDWAGKKQLRLKLTHESTYSNWLAAAALAKSNPELFTEESIQSKGSTSNARTLEALGIVKLEYALDEERDKLVLQTPESLIFSKGEGDESLRLYATELEIPAPVDINCQVHDIDVSHRLYDDYYGDERLEITIINYHNDDTSIRLSCAMYLNGSGTPEYISLPYDPSVMAAGKTTTIDVPLGALFDPATVQTARFVFSAPGITETADVNNEFTIYPGGSPDLRFTQDIWAEITRGGQAIAYTDTIPAKAGETVILHVSVTGGTKPCRYQWPVFNPSTGEWVNLRDGEAVSGASTDTLTLQSVRGDWDGRQARCVITDSSGATITSAPITLRVARATADEPELPDTGDHTHLPLYLTVAALALVVMAALRRRRED